MTDEPTVPVYSHGPTYWSRILIVGLLIAFIIGIVVRRGISPAAGHGFRRAWPVVAVILFVAFMFLGTRPDSGPAHPNHSNRMLVNEAALPTGIAMHVAVALDVLGGP